MPRWAYHGTSETHLPKIRQCGLMPGEAAHGIGVFFTVEYETAADYGDVVLRFAFPADAQYAPGEDAGVDEYLSQLSVPAERLWLFGANRWQRLTHLWP